MGKYQSGQMGQTVNLLAYAFGGSNPSLPTENQIVIIKRLSDFFYYISSKISFGLSAKTRPPFSIKNALSLKPHVTQIHSTSAFFAV